MASRDSCTKQIPDIDADDFQYIRFIYQKRHGWCSEKDMEWNKNTNILCIYGQMLCEQVIKIADDKYRDSLQLKGNTFKQAVEVIENTPENLKYQDVLAIPKEKTNTVIIMSLDSANALNFKHFLQLKTGIKKPSMRRRDRNSRKGNKDNLKCSEWTYYITYEKIEVFVGKSDILELDGKVECFVNPTNAKLDHIGQVSVALLGKAGDSYAEACGRHDGVTMTNCVVTRGGDLKTKYVVHAVCPTKNKYALRSRSLENDIFETVFNCLEKAETRHITSIAFPFISSGNGNVPIDVCSKQYAAAILEFSRKRKNVYACNKIYFVDICSDHVQRLTSVFTQSLPQRESQLLEIPTDYDILPTRKTESTPFETQTNDNAICTSDDPDQDPDQDYCNLLDDQVDAGYSVIGDVQQEFEYADSETFEEGYCPCVEEDGYSTTKNSRYQCIAQKEEQSESIEADEVDVTGGIDCGHENTNYSTDADNRRECLSVHAVNPALPINKHGDEVLKNTTSDAPKPIISPDDEAVEQVKNEHPTILLNEAQQSESVETDAVLREGTVDITRAIEDRQEMSKTPNDKVTPNTAELVKHVYSIIHINACDVHIYKGDIRNSSVDAILCPEDLKCPCGGHGLMAAALKATFRYSFKEEKLQKLTKHPFKKLKPTAVTAITKDGNKDGRTVRFLVHLATPFWHTESDSDLVSDSTASENKKQIFEHQLHVRIKEAFEKVEKCNKKRRIRSIAFPLMGIDNVDDKDAIRRSCRVMATCVKDFCNTQKQSVRVTEIHLVNRCPQITQQMLDWMTKLTE